MNNFNNKWILLLLGGILLGFTGMKWNIPIFAWLCLVPFLRYIRLGHSFWYLLFSLIGIQVLSTMRIVSEPFHLSIALLSGLQGGIVFSVLLIVWDYLRKKFQNRFLSIFSFAFLFTIMEWVGGYSSEFGVWGMMANSQINDRILIQSASIFGATGISFLIYWFNALVEEIIFEFETNGFIAKVTWSNVFLFIVIYISLLFYGTFRLTQTLVGKTIKIGTVTSQKEIQNYWNQPLLNQENTNLVIERTKQGAREGAKIIVWNEGGVLVHKSEEAIFLESILKLAKEYEIEIIAAYIVPLKNEEFFMENKIHWIGMDGSTRQIYHKQFIPPGEPISNIPSDIKVIETEWGPMSIAICYDFDSLKLSQRHANLGTGITLIAASDWKGIDPFHTEMAVLRGIENGTSIVRSTRGALSGIFDAYGRARGTLEYYESMDGVLVASVPTTPIVTIYRKYGNWIVGLGVVYFILLGIYRALFRLNFKIFRQDEF